MNLKFIVKFLKSIISSKNKFIVYSDGSHKGKWGSWAFIVVQDGHIVHESSGRAQKTNSLRMEFQGAIEALTFLPKHSEIIFYSDSRVLIECANKRLPPPHEVKDQFLKIEILQKQKNVSWNWVRSHSGNIYNERCDRLCTESRVASHVMNSC